MVEALFICYAAGQPMQPQTDVLAIQHSGLWGDRYSLKIGWWQLKAPESKRMRQVTLIGAESFDGTGVEYHQSRRNIVIRGLNPLELIGWDFLIGGALFRGIEDCPPCNRPEELHQISEFAKKFKNKGGLRAEVLGGGRISVGDEITLLCKAG